VKIPITKPYFTEEEKELVQKPLETGWIVQGPFVKELEKNFCEFTGAEYAAAMNSCTSAQFVASKILGLKAGDEVIIPAFTWVSTANAAEYLGARPVFVDVDFDTFNIDVNKIEEKITDKTRAIFPVHLFGLPADMNKISEIAGKHKLKISEDCACALGGKINGKHAGTFGACGCFSMHPRKSITTGEGGMLVTNSRETADLAVSLRDHGADRSDLERHQQSEGFLLPEYKYLGYNYRLTDIQGALGVAQFNKLEYILDRRKKIAEVYNSELKGSVLKTPYVSDGMEHPYQSYVCIYKYIEAKEALKKNDFEKIKELNKERNEFMKKLEEKGIATRQGTHAVHIQKYYAEKYGIDKYDYPNAYASDRLTVSLPLYPQMTEAEQGYVIESVKKVI